MIPRVYLSGCFHPLHEGHNFFFKKGSEIGRLYVGVMSDEYIKRSKNYEPPSQNQRAEKVLSTGYVDEIILLPDNSIKTIEMILKLSPDIHCLGPGQYDNWFDRHLRAILTRNNPKIQFVDMFGYERETNRSTYIRKKDDISSLLSSLH